MHDALFRNARVTALLAASALLCADGVQTGTLSGVVRSGGKVLPGARITLDGPSLVMARSLVTNEQGVYTAPILPPGSFTMTVTSLGFEPVKTRAEVRLGQTTRLNLNLAAIAGAIVEITAPGGVAAMDTTRVASQTDTTKETLDLLPLAHDVGGAMNLLPGVVQGGWNPRLGGGAINANIYLIDGVDTTDSSSGRAGMTLAQDAINIVQVITSGVGAEYGRFSGGVANVVTKSGSNHFEGSLRLTVNNLAWNATSPSINGQNNRPPSILNKVTYATVGGPIIKERLWLFLAGETTRQEIRQFVAGLGGSNPMVPYTGTLKHDRFSAKLTFAINTSHTLILQHTADPRQLPLDMSRAGDVSALTVQKDGGKFTQLTYRGILSDSMVLEGKLAAHEIPFSWHGSDNGRMSWWNRQFNQFTAFENPRFVGTSDRERTQANVSVTKWLELAGRHEIKAGLDLQKSRIEECITPAGDGFVFFNGFNPVTGGSDDLTVRFGTKYNYNMAGAMAQVFNTLPVGKSAQDVAAFYLQDKWTLANGLTMDAGVRGEAWRGEGYRGKKAWDYTTWSPRLGASYDLSGDSCSSLFASYGVYFQGPIQDGLANPSTYNPATRGFTWMLWDGSRDPRLKASWFANPALGPVPASDGVGIDPNLKGFRARETTVGYRLATTQGAKLEARWIYRRFEDPVDNLVYYDADSKLVSTLHNARTAKKLYRAVILTGEKPLGPWHFMANYAYARLEGNMDQNGYDSPYDNYAQGSWVPSVNHNNDKYGTLEGDRRDVIKAVATHRLNWGKAQLDNALIWTYVGGAAYSKSSNAVVPDPKGNPVLFQQIDGTRGSHRFPSYTTLDYSVTGSMFLAGNVKGFIRADIFNVLNRIRQISWDVMDSNLPTYGKAVSAINFTAPRMLMLTAGLKF